MIALILAGALSLQSDPGFERIWSADGAQMEAQGITRPMAELAYEWTVGQGLMGRCRAHLDADDVEFWRTWWRNTPLERSDMGRAMLEAGSESYTNGLEAALSDPLSPEHCRRVVGSWFDDMRALASQ